MFLFWFVTLQIERFIMKKVIPVRVRNNQQSNDGGAYNQSMGGIYSQGESGKK